MDKKELKKYSELIIETGVNLYPEQCLQINCGIKNYDFGLMIAESAYEKAQSLLISDWAATNLQDTGLKTIKIPKILNTFPLSYRKN